MAAIPLDVMLWLSLGIFGMGLFFVVPIWWRNWRVRRGADLPITEDDISGQTIARVCLLFGAMSALSTLLVMASRAMSFSAFMALCVAVGLAGMVIAHRIDVADRQR